MRDLWASVNQIIDIMPLTALIRLERLHLFNNQIRDISPLTELAKLRMLNIERNPLDYISIHTHIPTIQKKGTEVQFPKHPQPALIKISGDGQAAEVGTLLANPFVVKAMDEYGKPIANLLVTFTITNGDRILSTTTATTNDKGRAQTTFKTRTAVGINTVTVTATGIPSSVTFTVNVLAGPSVLIAASVRPPMYWIDTETGTLHHLSGDTVENLLPNVQNATDLAVDVANGKLYWTEQTSNRTGKIQRANLNGTDVALVKELTSVPLEIAIDAVGGTLYLVNSWGKIQRLSVDGANFEPNLITGLDTPTDIALDVTGGKIYWTEQAGSIRRANLDGSEVETVVSDLETPAAIVVSGSKLYWTEQVDEYTGKIQSANRNGRNVETLATVSGTPHGLAVDPTARQLYWTNALGGIQRANLDGSRIQNLVTELTAPGDFALHIWAPRVLIAESQRPSIYWTDTERNGFQRLVNGKKTVESLASDHQNITGLAVDVTGGKVYWTEQTSPVMGEIRYANLDGSNIQVIRSVRRVPRDLALDVAGRKIYYTNSNGTIGRVGFDGSKINKGIPPVRGLDAPNRIALDVAGGKLYWTETGESIRRANLNGRNVETLVSDLGTIGDIVVAGGKLYWTEQTGPDSGKVERADLDGSSVQTLVTLRSVPLGLGVDTTEQKLYWTNAGGKIQRANLKGKNIETVVTDLGRPTNLVLGIASAAATVAAAPAMVFPEETTLLRNFPNPFNPETWIPYQLAKPVDVTITIYTVNGTLVRTLTLGHQPAGLYQNRSRAAYWDGRNAFGEPVASGVYFYTLSTESTRDSVTAGDFTATRKMLIQK